MLGAVLAGGRSRRMGCTKALVEVEGVAMARRVADALGAGGCSPVMIVGGDEAELAVLELPIVPDLHPGEGPLGGVLTALDVLARRTGGADPDDAVLVAACDLAWLSEHAVASLIDAAATRPDVDVVVARGDRLEPAFAIWRTTARDRLRVAFDEGERAVHRAVRAVSSLDVDIDPAVLRNVNAPADLDR